MLKIEKLTVSYGQRRVLHGVDLMVAPGQMTAIIGPNGAGKSTLLRAVSGVLPFESGRVRYGDQDLNRLPPQPRARLMAVVPQARHLPEDFTVYETVLLGRTPYINFLGRTHPTDHQHVLEALENTQLSELAERRVGELSGGEQQRVLLARALAQDTPVLLLDEPTTHLDLHHQSALLNLVQRMARQKNLAVLMVLHELNLASLYAGQVALLYQGHFVAQGSPQQVLTTDLLSEVYRSPVKVVPHPEYGTPLVLPDGRL